METSYFFLLAFLLLLFVNGCCTADLKENVSTNSGLDPSVNGTSSSKEKTGGSISVTESVEVDTKKEKMDEVSKLKEANHVRNDVDKENSNEQAAGSKEGATVLKSDDKLKEELKGKEEKGKTHNFSDEEKSNNDQKKGGSEEDRDPLREDGARFEQCDSSNKCMDDENKFIACLRVPGNDSPDLSLLIQNKGKGPLSITISAPDFVQLEKTKVQLQGKEDKKLKVSVRSKGPNNLLILKAGNGNCSLDFRDLIAHNSEEDSSNSIKSSTYFNFQPRKPAIVFVSFAALLMLASGCMYLSFKRRKLNISASRYQRLDEDLPVSGVTKPDSDINDGWDNKWDDNWDDEEAPKTPSMPVTPSVSSKGLASRRLSKDGWKD